MRGYVYWKLRLDPVYEAVWKSLAGDDRPLLDLGCGAGLLSLYLRERGFEGEIEGVDLDAGKIEAARAAALDDPRTRFRAEAVTKPCEIRGHVTLLDVLHYLGDDDQKTLLDSICAGAPSGAKILIRETLADGSWRARVTWLEEVIARSAGWMRTTEINFPSRSSIEGAFGPEFDRDSRPLWGRTPFNSHLFEFRRR
jgi:cyclopropane fatty-acyl-phospholipid synthase-like methyltransferase